MKKLSVKDLVDFRGKSARSKKTFVENIKLNKPKTPTDGGGNYWTTSLSAVCNSYKYDDLDVIDEKIAELLEKLSNCSYSRTKNMYQRNIAILEKYKSMDLKKLRPSSKPTFLKKSSGNPILNIKGLQVEAKPSHIFTFGKKDEEKVGAIWFAAKKDAYRIEEVSIFCDLQYRFLKHNYAKQYQLSSKYCLAVDILSGQTINYSNVEGGELSNVLASTLDEINSLM